MSQAVATGAPPATVTVSTGRGRLSILAFAWVAVLALSSLPNILVQELGLTAPVSLLTLKLLILAGFLGLTLVWTTVKPLRLFFGVFLALLITDELAGWVGATALWSGLFAGSGFTVEMMSTQLLRLGVALAMITVLWLIYRNRRAFYLAAGDLDAPAAPMRWLGLNRPVGWRRLGWVSALCITLGTLAFLVVAGGPSFGRLGQVVPLLPAVVLFAAMNAFSEETTYRASLLAPLRDAVGPSQALLLTAALFGLWHFYGVPYGIVGVALAGALGWYLGKSMLETRGLFWPWFIHFWQDVAIFAFIAVGSITPGG
jgi:uncharacterized protein